jgi:DnaK suppressor protein
MPAVTDRARLKHIEEILRTEKAKMRDALRSELAERLGAGHSAQFEDALDTGDLSFFDLLETIDVKLIGIRQEQITNMSEAERKLQDGSYGICENCGKEIGDQRLAALPFAIHCIRCAEQLEGAEVKGKGPSY